MGQSRPLPAPAPPHFDQTCLLLLVRLLVLPVLPVLLVLLPVPLPALKAALWFLYLVLAV